MLSCFETYEIFQMTWQDSLKEYCRKYFGACSKKIKADNYYGIVDVKHAKQHNEIKYSGMILSYLPYPIYDTRNVSTN